MRFAIVLSPFVLGLAYASATQADIFGRGSNSFEIEFVLIGNPGNPGNPPSRGFSSWNSGAVPYNFRMGKYEVSESMIDKANSVGGLGITHNNYGPNKPAMGISWYEAASFVNWLNTSTGYLPTYKFDLNGSLQLWEPGDIGYDPANLFRNKQAKYFLPTNNEWHKAACYDPVTGGYYLFPTGAMLIPVACGTDPGTAVFAQPFTATPADIKLAGGLSPYGTMAQAGNVGEWAEPSLSWRFFHPSSPSAPARGGDYSLDHVNSFVMSSSYIAETHPNTERRMGFRVASVPEPSAEGLVIMACGVIWVVGMRAACRLQEA